MGFAAYVDGLKQVVDAFPDYRWQLETLLVDDPWIAAWFTDTGTHKGTFLGVPPTGRAVETHELAFYRVASGKFVEVWGTDFDRRLLGQIQ